MPSNDQELPQNEQLEFFSRVLGSQAFRRSQNLRDLLNFLFGAKDRKLSAGDIEKEHYKHPVNSSEHDPGHARERIMALQKLLKDYQLENPDDPLAFHLPNANEHGGYQLQVRRQEEKRSAGAQFWAAIWNQRKKSASFAIRCCFSMSIKKGEVPRPPINNREGNQAGTV